LGKTKKVVKGNDEEESERTQTHGMVRTYYEDMNHDDEDDHNNQMNCSSRL
jgi:hypothetical protein